MRSVFADSRGPVCRPKHQVTECVEMSLIHGIGQRCMPLEFMISWKNSEGRTNSLLLQLRLNGAVSSRKTVPIFVPTLLQNRS